MAKMIPCSGCGDLIRVKDDIIYQKPKCYNCTNNKKIKKDVDKVTASDTISCIMCGRSYVKSTDPYSKSIKCPRCYDSNGRLYWWKS